MQSFLLRLPPTTEDNDSTHPFVTGLTRNIRIMLSPSSFFKVAKVVGCYWLGLDSDLLPHNTSGMILKGKKATFPTQPHSAVLQRVVTQMDALCSGRHENEWNWANGQSTQENTKRQAGGCSSLHERKTLPSLHRLHFLQGTYKYSLQMLPVLPLQ